MLARTRWQLRRAVRTLNQTFAELRLVQHRDKTFNQFSRGPLRLAHRTLQNHVTRLHWLYEQQKTAPVGAVRLDEYVARWTHPIPLYPRE